MSTPSFTKHTYNTSFGNWNLGTHDVIIFDGNSLKAGILILSDRSVDSAFSIHAGKLLSHQLIILRRVDALMALLFSLGNQSSGT